jgi:nucleotide-binding universal stress UspA family protein
MVSDHFRAVRLEWMYRALRRLMKMSATKNGKKPRIVAGVDGSPASLAALRWAVRQAETTGGFVDAVIAWQIPTTLSGYGWAPLTIAECSEFVETATKTVQEAVSEVTGPEGNPRVHTVVAEGNPAQVLLDASEGADLLVLGTRGHGWFTETVLGSVSQDWVHHAHCPVVVMRGASEASAKGKAA